MNYETYIKEVQHFKTLLELDKLMQEERIAKRENLKHLLGGYIFCPISTWSSSIREIVEHDTITGKNTFQMILFPYGHGISQDVLIEYLYTLFLNTSSKIRKRIHQLMWIMTKIYMHQHKWYYFDMYHRSFLLIDGLTKINVRLHTLHIQTELHHLPHATQYDYMHSILRHLYTNADKHKQTRSIK